MGETWDILMMSKVFTKAQNAKVRILLTGELEILRDALRPLLTSRPGWDVCGEAAHCKEATDKALRLRPDIIVFDLDMPPGNGLEVIRLLRKKLPQARTLAIVLRNTGPLQKETVAAGAQAFILKADVKRLLTLAVESLVRHKPFLSRKIHRWVARERHAEAHPAKGRNSHGVLTPREQEIVKLVAEGRTSKEIGSKLDRSFKTIEAHRANIVKKLNIHSTSELVRYAIRNKIIEG